ncbi:hypothetical protein [Algoriphagus mannitolivorans]|uniref:hypothetical protein n=1 Tax=Algoriphagus mannitolivorans TaxID=226504 RepID=UPI00041E83D3|nr:hypothetical protein [Algoriphagus mannitolivorans]
MRKIRRAYYSIVFMFAMSSCSPCRNLDCLVSQYDFEFRILDSNTGSDLVFGSKRIFDPREFSMFSISGTGPQEYPLQIRASSFFTGDTTFYAEVFPPASQVFLQYPNGKIDTLELSYRQFDSECCGRITEITKLIRNKTQSFTQLREVLEFIY